MILADLAITLPVLLSSGDDPPLVSAPWWLFAALNGGGDGIRLPGMTGDQIWTVGDTTDFDAYVFLLYAGLALGVIMTRTARTAAGLRPATP